MTDARKAASNAEVESAALVDGLPEQESVSRAPQAPLGDGVAEALRSAREEIEQARASVSGDDGYNYASGEEYGLRRAVIILDKALAALSAKGEASPAEAAGADPRMIARIRELSTPPKDDYDRRIRSALSGAAPQAGEDARDLAKTHTEAWTAANALATILHAKHYAENTGWRLDDSLFGVILQIDNMTSGLAKPVAAPPVEGWRPHTELITAAVAFLTRYDGGLARIRVNGNMMDAKAVADALAALPKRDPDHVYNIDGWEFTSAWEDRINLTDDMPLGSLMHVGVLYDGPAKWAAHVPVTWDDDGDPDETEVQWFDSKADAEAALGRKPTQPDSQGGEDAAH